MSSNEKSLVLTRLVDALPAWMEPDQAAKMLVARCAEREISAFVRVPAGAIVVEQQLFFRRMSTSFAGAMQEPLVSAAQLMKKLRGGDVMDHPAEMPRIRFLELGNADLHDLAISGKIRRHWFRGPAVSVDESGSKLISDALRCMRPALRADANNNRAESRFLMALTYDSRFEFSFTTEDVYVPTSEAIALSSEIFRPDGDVHHLFVGAPAVFALYSAAKKFSSALRAVPRNHSKGNTAKLEELRAQVSSYLETFGGPYKSLAVKKHAFRVIDPLTPWGRGSSRAGTFEEAASKVDGFYDKYAFENFVGDGLGLILYITRWLIKQRLQLGSDEGTTKDVMPGVIHQRLKKLNFDGVSEIEAIASIILWQQKPLRRTPSEKKPGPIRARRR